MTRWSEVPVGCAGWSPQPALRLALNFRQMVHSLGRIVLIVLVASRAPLIAQEPPPLDAGHRVRLTFPCESADAGLAGSEPRACRAEGSLARLIGDTIVLAAGKSEAATTSAYDLNEVSRVEVSTGTKSHWLTGAAIGFVVGGTVAYLALSSGGSTSTCDQSANQDAISVGECIALATAVGGLPGFGLGALVGTFIRSERWQQVPLDRLRVSVGPGPGSGLGLAIVIHH